MNMPLRDLKQPVDYVNYEYWGTNKPEADTTEPDGAAMLLLLIGTIFGLSAGYFFWG